MIILVISVFLFVCHIVFLLVLSMLMFPLSHAHGPCCSPVQARQWMSQVAQWRAKLQMPANARPWSRHREVRESGVALTERHLAILDLAVYETVGPSCMNMSFEQLQCALKNIYCDLSQNPQRRAFTKDGMTNCLTTSTCLYMFWRADFVLSNELLYIQGHRRSIVLPQDMTSNQIRDLAGEGISLPSLATVVWALYLTKGLP